jgi:hypothetical protein
MRDMTLKEYNLSNKIFNLEKLESWYYATNQDMKYIEVHNLINELKRLYSVRLTLKI